MTMSMPMTAQEKSESISISFEQRGGAAGRSNASKADYFSANYQRETKDTDVNALVRLHPRGSNDLDDTFSVSFGVEREFAIGERFYHAVNFGYDKHGTNLSDANVELREGEYQKCLVDTEDPSSGTKDCNLSSPSLLFGSVDAFTAAWSVGVRKKVHEVDVGWDFLAEGPRLTASVELFGVNISVDAVWGSDDSDEIKGEYVETNITKDVGNARFFYTKQMGLDEFTPPEWKDKNGKGCAENACGAGPGYSVVYGIAYVKHF